MSTAPLNMPIEAILLAGGEGMRLRPLTARLPKPLLPVGNQPMIAHILHGLSQSGIGHAALATGYKADVMQAALGAQFEGVGLQYVVENQPLGSGGALRNVLSQCEVSDEVWVAGADILHNVDIAAAQQFHRAARAQGGLVTVIAGEVEDTTGFGICEADSDGRIQRFLEKPEPGTTISRLANTALWIFSREALEMLPDGASSVERDLFPTLARSGQIWVWQHRGFWLDCGTPERLIEANLGALAGFFPADLQGTRSNGSLLDAGCSVAPDSVLTRCTLGRDVTVQADAQLQDCVLLDGATIGAGARLERCSVESGAQIPAATSAQDEILT